MNTKENANIEGEKHAQLHDNTKQGRKGNDREKGRRSRKKNE